MAEEERKIVITEEISKERGRMQMDSGRVGARFLRLCLIALLVAGCFAPAKVPTQPVEAQQFRSRQGRVSVGVDPYFTTERVVPIFRGGENFAGSGVLPVQVTIENGSEGEISVDPRDFRLAHPNSQVDLPISAESTFGLVRIQVQYWALLPIVGPSVTAARNEPILRDLEARELKEGKISPGGSTTGFVYFQVSETLKNLAGDVMVVVVKDASGRNLIFEIPIQGQRDLPPSLTRSTAADTPAPPKPVPLDPKNPKGPVVIEGAGGGVIIRSPAQ